MAVAEARAAWQRCNRYFVQEDAKRAPKLASRQSSNPSSKKPDTEFVDTTNRLDHPSIGFMPFNSTPYSNLPPDAKWWLHIEPNYFHRRGLNVAMEENCPKDEDNVIHNVNNEDLESFLDVKKHKHTELKDVDVVEAKVDQDVLDVKTMTDYYEAMEMEMIGKSVSSDSSWVGGEKVPWWRVTDGEEIASFVAHKSLSHIGNCDLPPPQKMKVGRENCKQGGLMDHDEILISSLERESISEYMSSPSSGESQGRHWASVKGDLSRYSQSVKGVTEPLRANVTADKETIPLNDPNKAKLLEALFHSQTRAREAEKAAKQAYSEKKHILKLFFKQASQLFAYKQWFKILQLENLLLQTDNSNSPSFSVFPDILPQIPENPQKPHKPWKKSSTAKKRKRGSGKNGVGKYAVAFAVGVTLVGAGLILGWTVGWMLPAF